MQKLFVLFCAAIGGTGTGMSGFVQTQSQQSFQPTGVNQVRLATATSQQSQAVPFQLVQLDVNKVAIDTMHKVCFRLI